jgi:thiosulfate/3-mercaptopyruvate sulfurtransferase
LQRLLPPLQRHHLAASVVGVLVLATAWFLHAPRSAQTHTPMFGEPVASSQPSVGVLAEPSAYGADEAARAAALQRFGQDAKADGFAHPESMVSARELAAALGAPNLVVLDVRPKERFEEGHIPTARQVFREDYSSDAPIPGYSLDAPALYAMLARVGAAPGAVLVAYTDGGPEAYRLWWTLREVAGVELRVLDGGLMSWKDEGHGLAMGEGLPVTPASQRAPKAPARAFSSTWSDVTRFRERHPTALLLDTRGLDEFKGEKLHKEATRKGHIPGAQHMDWFAIVRSTEDDHRLAPPEALRPRFEAVGVTPDVPVVLHCQSGTRSAASFFALHQLGHPDERLMNYDGSWAEYSRSSLPVE